MISFLVLGLWSAIGVSLAVLTSRSDESRFAWAPFAVILGPLWATVAIDRQKIADDVDAHRMR